jgi:uracil-DNA glycosylase
VSRIALVGEAWGEWEDAGKHPFCGVSGVCLFEMLCEAGLTTKSGLDIADIKDFWFFRNQEVIEPRPMMRLWARHQEFFLTNVFNLRPEKNEIESLCVSKSQAPSGLPALRAGKYLAQEHLHELIRLGEDLRNSDIGLIVCLGGTATWALLHNPGITKLRGTVAAATHVVPGRKLLAAYHPAAILRQWELRHVSILDLIKAKREAEFLEIRRPRRQIRIIETISDTYRMWPLPTFCRQIAIDIETAADQITCVQFAYSPELAYVIPFVDNRKEHGSYWNSFVEEQIAWDTVRKICASTIPKILQNGLYDSNFLWSKYGIPINNFAEDTMLCHHALQPESPKGLDFLGSVYTNESAWKLIRTRGKTTIKKDE